MINKIKFNVAFLALCYMLTFGCKKDFKSDVGLNEETIIKNKLKELGFNLEIGFRSFKDGYLVENDIFLTKAQIFNTDSASIVNIEVPNNFLNRNISGGQGKISHYSTDNAVLINSVTKRNINVYIDPSFSIYYNNCIDIALNRYNEIDFGLTFTKVANISMADIKVLPYYEVSTTLAYAGFPSGNNPFSFVYLNTYHFSNFSNRLDGPSTIAHEIGHCIGFRHTDANNRSYSCGTGSSEPSSSGMNHIPNTPVGGSPDSWMLACSNGLDRPFTQQDYIALKVKYPFQQPLYIREVRRLTHDNTYYTWCCDHISKIYDLDLEFYQDSMNTIPFVTNKTMLKFEVDSRGYKTIWVQPVQDGITRIDNFASGLQVQEEWQYGNLVYNNNENMNLMPYTFYKGVWYDYQ